MTEFFLSPQKRKTYIINLLQSLNNDEDLLVKSIGKSIDALNKLQPLESVEAEQQEAVRKLYQHILDRYGRSHKFQEEGGEDCNAARRKYSTDNEEGDSVGTSNDNCEVCDEPGHLICCSTCPMVFHQDCVRPILRSVPKGDWSCPFCHVAGINVVKRGRRLSRDNACQGIDEMRAMAKERRNQNFGTGGASPSWPEKKNDSESKNMSSSSNKKTKHCEKHPTKAQTPPVTAADSLSGKKRSLESLSSSVDTTTTTATTTTTTTPGNTRSKRARKQPTLYDPQVGAASSWKTDGAAEWRYVSKDYNCSLCHDIADITVCPYCGCRACFGKHKEESIILCDGIGCEAEYHLHCLSPPLRKVPSVQWFCPDCKRARAANKEFSSNSGSRALSDRSKLVSRSTKASTKVAIADASSDDSEAISTGTSTCTNSATVLGKSNAPTTNLTVRGTKYESISSSAAERSTSLPLGNTQTQSTSSRRLSMEESASSLISGSNLFRIDQKEQSSIANTEKTSILNNSTCGRGDDSENRSSKDDIRKNQHEVQSRVSISTATGSRKIEMQHEGNNVIASGCNLPSECNLSSEQTEDDASISKASAGKSTPQEVSHDSIVSSSNKLLSPTNQPQQLRSRSGRVVKKKSFYIDEDEGEQHLKSLRYTSDHSRKPQQTAIATSDQKQVVSKSSNKDNNSSSLSVSATTGSVLSEKKGPIESQKLPAGKKGSSPAPAHPGPPGNALGNIACAMPSPYDLPGLMKHFPVPFNVDFSRPPNVAITKPKPKSGVSDSRAVHLGQQADSNFRFNVAVAPSPIAPATATSAANATGKFSINQVTPKGTSTATSTSTSHVTSGNEKKPPQTFLSPITGQPLSKEPRRKPGARECMQISRRFGVKVVPQKYMEILLDYCSRGKLEHLIRMRERLDDHSKLLEYQLAALEDLVREKGAQFPGETYAPQDAGGKKNKA
mmetsp:Transcript_24493/g.37805  ORF Transcript_24493/g.37805 Transcript_24493/m.37805 type:complete len:954 (+) Transcript_24493:51-2912(+)|eukprot:CAMPEP_0196810420 /NCGR_PEP_ID=MMETSP1362-20130617/10241_1 /TAXON_ID=163516 /ORGANISM="Leptocylindrus danicus, Strain CCMP1856" /LENGTH=953 /DNA_ID=CAMNT_0042185405 /DNA_START=41 /DNA_END=2902 /DNA_ORIENTATION=+